MTQYSSKNIMSNSQLIKLNSAIKTITEVTFEFFFKCDW